MLLIPNYSPLTVMQIRYGDKRDGESPKQVVTRLAETFALAEPTIRVLMQADEKFLDCYGRLN